MYLFVWRSRNAIIRSAFPAKHGRGGEWWCSVMSIMIATVISVWLCRRQRSGFFLRREWWSGGRSREKGAAEPQNRGVGMEGGEMIGGWRAEANVGQMYQSASVALLLKIIYQCVSGSDVMDIAWLDWSRVYWGIDHCHSQSFVCVRSTQLGSLIFNDVSGSCCFQSAKGFRALPASRSSQQTLEIPCASTAF